MKALVPAGRPGALVAIAQTSMPEPAPGEALVKVEAFSVNRGEIFRLEDPRQGDLPGKGLGEDRYDCCQGSGHRGHPLHRCRP